MAEDRDFATLMKKFRKRLGWSQEALASRSGVHRNTISKLETRSKLPTKQEALQLAREFQLEGEERKTLLLAAKLKGNEPLEVPWNVPHHRKRFFVGREALLQSLRKSLVPGGRITALTQAIIGLGGIGKTQVAVEYAHRFAQDYEAVLWLQADSWKTLTAECLRLATEHLELPEQQEAEKQVEKVKSWLQTHHRWLLILDDLEEPQEILHRFLPTKHQGSVLVTTRRQDVEKFAQCEVLPVFSRYEGVLFLLRRTGTIGQKAPLRVATRKEISLAKNLYKLLDGLPLALDQAGAYIRENGSSFQRYIDRYQQYRQQLLGIREDIDHPASVLITFKLSWGQIQQKNALAGKALLLCAFLAPNQIPEQFVISGLMMSDMKNAPEELEMDEALGLLYRYSLIDRAEQILSMHRLVQETMQGILPEEEQYYWMKIAIIVVNNAFPNGSYETWSLCEFLLPHALVCSIWTSILRQKKSAVVGAWLLSATGRYLCDRARYKDAEPLLLQAFSIIEEQLGAFHPETAVCLNNLASLYEKQGRYEDAEPLYQRALAISEKQLGPAHLATATSLNNLASFYEKQGHYEDAEPLHKQALSIREEQLGTFHPETAGSLNNLASLYEKQGRYEDAEPLYQRALAISEKQLGPAHPQTATSLNNLALFYTNQGRYKDAEPLYQRSLFILEEQLGASHPDTAITLNNLAELYRAQKRYRDAEPLYQRALTISEKQLGPSHPETAIQLNNLALLYVNQGCYGDAEPLYKQALSILEKQLGVFHPDTTNTLNNLAGLYYQQGCYPEAESLYQRALTLSRMSLGSKHPQTRQVMMHYLALLSDRYTNGDMNILLQLLRQGQQDDILDGESL